MKPNPVALPARPPGLRFNAEAAASGRFEVNAGGAMPVISILGGIDQGLTQQVADALREIGPRPVLVEVNSKGGDFFEGIGVHNVLARHPAPITASIIGIAASAASVIVMGADTIEIYASGTMMVHNASGLAIGNRHAMLEFAAVLEQLDSTMSGIYAARSSAAGGDLTAAAASALMDAESFLTADRARQLGLADVVVNKAVEPAPQPAASMTPRDKRELESVLRGAGYSRSVAARMTSAAWPAARQSDPESELDLDAIARVIADNIAATAPRQPHR